MAAGPIEPSRSDTVPAGFYSDTGPQEAGSFQFLTPERVTLGAQHIHVRKSDHHKTAKLWSGGQTSPLEKLNGERDAQPALQFQPAKPRGQA